MDDGSTAEDGAQGSETHGETLRKFSERYRRTHAEAISEIRSGRKRSCWSWWIWPTNYRPGASGMSLEYALTDDEATAFIGDAYLRSCWVEMMTAVAEQLEAGVTPRTLCGIDVPRVPATCDLFRRVSGPEDSEIQELCARVSTAMDTTRKKRKAALKVPGVESTELGSAGRSGSAPAALSPPLGAPPDGVPAKPLGNASSADASGSRDGANAGVDHHPSALRNRVPISVAVRKLLPTDSEGLALEVGSGTGAHLEILAADFPKLQWRPSEYAVNKNVVRGFHEDTEGPGRPREGILTLQALDSFLSRLDNVLPALEVDVSQPFDTWPEELSVATEGDHSAGPGSFALMYSSNVLHITPWAVTVGLFAGAGAALRPGGSLMIHGPFKADGKYSTPETELFVSAARLVLWAQLPCSSTSTLPFPACLPT